MYARWFSPQVTCLLRPLMSILFRVQYIHDKYLDVVLHAGGTIFFTQDLYTLIQAFASIIGMNMVKLCLIQTVWRLWLEVWRENIIVTTVSCE